MFTDSKIQKAFSSFDWLATTAGKLAKEFPEAFEAKCVESLSSLAIRRYEASSVTCGVFEMMTGRVVYCVQGDRFYMGMSIEQVMASFQSQFDRWPCSLRETACWLRQMSLEEIMTDGWFCLVRSGDILTIPPCHIIFEAFLGTLY